MGNEKEFSKRVRGALKKAGCAVYPVETGATGTGFPDLVVLHEGGASFIELKCRPNVVLSRLSAGGIEGPGQRAFSRQLARRTSYRVGKFFVINRSFLLVECMDGVALMVEEKSGAYLAACWEGLPSGGDLVDMLRAWRVAIVPSSEAEHDCVMDVMRDCASIYEVCTGIRPIMGGQIENAMCEVGGKDGAVSIARDICNRGRVALLTESIKSEEGKKQEVPLEKGNGYVILTKEV